MPRKQEILVLESPWSEDIADRTSVRLFIKGWAEMRNMEMAYHMFHDRNDLTHWIYKYISHPTISVCYIAGHGSGSRLCGLSNDINPTSIAKATKKRGKGGSNNKGILLGACEVGSDLGYLLGNCGRRICWVAGYDREIPWMEGTICDLLFLEYKIFGRIKVNSNGDFVMKRGKFMSSDTRRAERAAEWVRRDCKLAVRCGFKAIDRS